MNTEQIMRDTMLNLQRVFCEEHGIEYGIEYDNFDLYYGDYIKKGFTPKQSAQLAYEICENEQ